MRSPLAGFWTLFAVVVILWNSTVQAAENTIVVSVTVTTPNWVCCVNTCYIV